MFCKKIVLLFKTGIHFHKVLISMKQDKQDKLVQDKFHLHKFLVLLISIYGTNISVHSQGFKSENFLLWIYDPV